MAELAKWPNYPDLPYLENGSMDKPEILSISVNLIA